MTEFAGNAGDSVDVVVIAEGDSFKFEFKPNTSGDPIPVPVNANEFDLKPGQCHPRLGRVGFFAGDDEDGDAASRFRMDTVKITPLASQPPPNNDGSPQPGM